jgi:hypothetical protein
VEFLFTRQGERYFGDEFGGCPLSGSSLAW